MRELIKILNENEYSPYILYESMPISEQAKRIITIGCKEFYSNLRKTYSTQATKLKKIQSDEEIIEQTVDANIVRSFAKRFDLEFDESEVSRFYCSDAANDLIVNFLSEQTYGLERLKIEIMKKYPAITENQLKHIKGSKERAHTRSKRIDEGLWYVALDFLHTEEEDLDEIIYGIKGNENFAYLFPHQKFPTLVIFEKQIEIARPYLTDVNDLHSFSEERPKTHKGKKQKYLTKQLRRDMNIYKIRKLLKDNLDLRIKVINYYPFSINNDPTKDHINYLDEFVD